MAEGSSPKAMDVPLVRNKILDASKVPVPIDMGTQKLDWLLPINDKYFEEQLKKVVRIHLDLPIFSWFSYS